MTPERWREVTQIYGAVLSRAPERRAAAVAELCGADGDLRREVESLLNSQHGVALLDGAAADHQSVMQMVLPIGSQIGVFRIDSLLGVGGMGEVYRARDTKLNRDVAIKILPSAFANDPDRLARFKREAQVLASVNHPNVGGMSGRSSAQQLTFSGKDRYPIWSSDGKRIAFQSDREGDDAIFWQPADGTTPAERLTKPEPGISHVPETWSPDGRTLLFASTKNGISQLWTLSITDRKTVRFADVESLVMPASTFSPDGRWVSYTSREIGRENTAVYMRPFPATATKYLVTSNGFRSLWSRDGKELFFARRGQSFVVSIPPDRTSAVGNPVELPIRRFPPPGGPEREYDVLPDGRQFVFAYPVDVPSGRLATGGQVNVVLNWSEELKQKVPTR